MVREAPAGLPVDAGGREAGYNQLARVPYASMAPASAPDLQMCLQRGGVLCLITAVLIEENGAERSDACR